MTHLVDHSECVFNNVEEDDNNLSKIRKKLLDDFETVETICDVLKTAKAADSREPIRVYLRVRPLTDQEVEAGESQDCLQIENERTVGLHPPKSSFNFKHHHRNAVTGETIQRFTFSRVFGPQTKQKRFFEETSLDVVKDFINGQNCLVFSYGITNAGKTYTILGDRQNAGILPRTFKILFNTIKEKNYESSNIKPKMYCDVVKLSSIQEESEITKKKNLLLLNDMITYHQSISSSDLSLQDSTVHDPRQLDEIIDLSTLLDATSVDVDDQGPIQFSLWISFAEIYNELVYDLLEPISMTKEGKRRILRVGDDRNGNPYIKGLTEIHINNVEEACKLLKIGRKNQKIACTKLNTHSSRSHCIFTLKILRVVNTEEPHVARVSRLSFVDLAGSERYAKTQNSGVRIKEAGSINTSIMTLGKCVELLRFNQHHTNNQKNIPFRESKLTRLFQGFFCGKGKASMIVNVNPCASAFDETLHALKFSAIAKKVTTIAHGTHPTAPIPNNRAPRLPKRVLRSSVAWADGSTATPVGNEIRETLDPTCGVIDESLRTPSFVNQVDYEKLVAELQIEIINAKKELAYMEVKIRQEVSQEMAEQLVEIEKVYNDRAMEEQRATEELYEKRIDILTKSVKKARKRPRVEERVEDNNEEDVSGILLRQEQVKNAELTELVAELNEKLSVEQVRIADLEKERISVQHLEEKMKELEERGVSEREAAKKRFNEMRHELEAENCAASEKINSLHEKVVAEQQTADLRVAELKAEHDDDGKLVIQYDKEIKRLKETNYIELCELRKVIEDQEKKIVSLEDEMAKKEIMSSYCGREAHEKCLSLENELKSREQRIVMLEKELKDTKADLAGKNTQLMTMKTVRAGQRPSTPTQLITAKTVRAGQGPSTPTQLPKNNVVKQLEKRLQDSTAALDQKNSQLIEKNKTIAKLNKNVNELRDDLKNKEDELFELRERVSRFDDSEVIVREKDNTIVQLSAQLKEKQSMLLNKTKETEEVIENLRFVEGELQILSSKEEETQKDISILSNERDSLKCEMEKCESKLEESGRNEEMLRQKVEEFRKNEEKMEEQTLKFNSEIEELKQSIRLKEIEIKKIEDDKTERLAELLKNIKSLEETQKKTEERVQKSVAEFNLCQKSNEKQLKELIIEKQEIQAKFDQALCDLSFVQASVSERNRELDSLNDTVRCKEDEVRTLQAECAKLRNELKTISERKNDRIPELDDEKEKIQKLYAELSKADEKRARENVILKKGLAEQENLMAKMDVELASKVQEIADLSSQIERLHKDNDVMKELRKTNGDLEEQSELHKIKIFELETEVEKLHQNLEKETTKKDTATQALRDGLAIAKTKKKEYEAKLEEIEKENALALKAYEEKVADLKQEMETLKSEKKINGGKTLDNVEHKVFQFENGSSSSNENGDFEYKPIDVESLNSSPRSDRVEIDVTPITGRGLVNSGKKTGGKSRALKRTSSSLTLKEIQRICSDKKLKNDSEDDFTPASKKKTRSSTLQHLKQKAFTCSTVSLPGLKENSENADPRKTRASTKLFSKFPFSSDDKDKPKTGKGKRRKLLKKIDISSPIDSPLAVKMETVNISPASSRAQDVIMRRLRSRYVKVKH